MPDDLTRVRELMPPDPAPSARVEGAARRAAALVERDRIMEGGGRAARRPYAPGRPVLVVGSVLALGAVAGGAVWWGTARDGGGTPIVLSGGGAPAAPVGETGLGVEAIVRVTAAGKPVSGPELEEAAAVVRRRAEVFDIPGVTVDVRPKTNDLRVWVKGAAAAVPSFRLLGESHPRIIDAATLTIGPGARLLALARRRDPSAPDGTWVVVQRGGTTFDLGTSDKRRPNVGGPGVRLARLPAGWTLMFLTPAQARRLSGREWRRGDTALIPPQGAEPADEDIAGVEVGPRRELTVRLSERGAERLAELDRTVRARAAAAGRPGFELLVSGNQILRMEAVRASDPPRRGNAIRYSALPAARRSNLPYGVVSGPLGAGGSRFTFEQTLRRTGTIADTSRPARDVPVGVRVAARSRTGRPLPLREVSRGRIASGAWGVYRTVDRRRSRWLVLTPGRRSVTSVGGGRAGTPAWCATSLDSPVLAVCAANGRNLIAATAPGVASVRLEYPGGSRRTYEADRGYVALRTEARPGMVTVALDAAGREIWRSHPLTPFIL